MDSSNREEPPKELQFRSIETITFHLSVKGRHFPRWLVRLLRPIERPLYHWLKRRRQRRYVARP